MADIASLGVVVRPDGIQQTTQQLDGLTKAGATAEKQAAKIAPAMDKAAMSAKQLAFATRGLPAQFTDIAVSLQAGQSPLTVLLQQGGQIKDQFGGAVPALRAVAGYVSALISPATLLAGAVAALGIAWRQGSNESVEFNKALALTNNYAGTTADRLQVMSAQLSALGVTQGAAADALAEVATTGRFTEQQLRLVTEAAISMQVATGQAVEDTVKEYAKLADDPVKAVVQLNDKYHFLTESVYEQIKALQQQGREQDAATLAIETFARTHTQRAQEVIASADGITKAWRDIKFGISDAFDTLRNFGRLQTEVGQASYNIAQAQNQLRGIAERLRGGRDPFTGAVFTKEQIAEDRRRVEELKKIIEDSQRVLANDPKVAAARKQAAAQRANDAAIAIDQEATTYASATDKLRAKQTEARGRADEAIRLALASGNKKLAEQIEADSKVIQTAIDKQIKDAEKRAAPKVRKVREKADPAYGIVARIKEQIALNEAVNDSA
ncbi:MAG TPA: phage tail length tape measure family protein [Lysobacter sp.]